MAELHGNVRKSLCVDCEQVWDTEIVLAWVEAGELDPACPDCGGMVKTATVMFGEILPQEEMEKAMEFLAMADAIIVVGSTVSVSPASDIVMYGGHLSLPIVIINQGPTEADEQAAVKIDAAIGEVLPGLVEGVLAG